MKNSYSLLLVLSLVLLSCEHKYHNELIEVNELQVKAKGIKDSFSTIDAKKIETAFAEYNMIMGQIKMYYAPDTITENQSAALDQYKGIKKGAKAFQNDYGNVKNNISLLESQLEKLKFDLENKVIDATKIETFLEHERKNLELVQQNFSTLMYNYDYVIRTHDTLGPKVKSMIFNNGY